LSGLEKIYGVGEVSLSLISDLRKLINPEQEYEKLQKANCSFITPKDEDYPELLLETYAHPYVLFYKGQRPKKVEPLQRKRSVIAVVGTRRINHYGQKLTEEFVTHLVGAGFTIVSGLARGVDTVAHDTTLKEGGITWAVLGCGLDTIYPPENRSLYKKICETGTIFSEFPLGTPPLPEHFPRRNRIITGLSQGVLVVQCAKRSGALISAKYAVEQNREVFAVPGNIDNPLSEGPNSLIKQGAKLVESVDDILEEFKLSYPQQTSFFEISLTIEEKQVYEKLSAEPMQFDLLSNQLKLPMPKLAELLMALEFKDAVKQLPGKYYVRA